MNVTHYAFNKVKCYVLDDHFLLKISSIKFNNQSITYKLLKTYDQVSFKLIKL